MSFKPAAVIFDMDGLLLDSEPLYRETWQRAARELGHPIDDELYARFVGRGNVEARAILRSAFGDAFDHAAFAERWTGYWRESVRARSLAAKRGAAELIDFLDGQGTPKAVATSSPRDFAVPSLGALAARFDAIVTGDDVAHAKPAPDLFLLAAARLEVAPSSCLVLEDSEAGFRAARAAKMEVIVVPDLVPPTTEMAEGALAICATLHEVRALIGACRASAR